MSPFLWGLFLFYLKIGFKKKAFGNFESFNNLFFHEFKLMRLKISGIYFQYISPGSKL